VTGAMRWFPLADEFISDPEVPEVVRLRAPDGEIRIMEHVSGWSSARDGRTYQFVCCRTGTRVDARARDGWHWCTVTVEALRRETGLTRDRIRRSVIEWRGAWNVRELRHPVMRALAETCTELHVACGWHELQCLILNEHPGDGHTRFNSTRQFGADVADRVDAGTPLLDAIEQQFHADALQALRMPAMACSFVEDWFESTYRNPRPILNLWEGRADLIVQLAALRDAAQIPALLTDAVVSVERCAAVIDAEIDAGRAGPDGALQLALV
jgi:hypothetical protein